MLRSVTWALRGILHNFVCGHCHPLINVSSDTIVFAVCPSYILTSSPSHTDTYPASENFLPLRRDWLANYSTTFTMHSGSRPLCSILAMFVAGLGCPSSSAKILLDLCSVLVKGSPTIPAWDVNSVSHSGEGIDPSSTPFWICCSVRLVCIGCSLFFLCACVVLLHGCRRNVVLSLSMCCWGMVKRTR